MAYRDSKDHNRQAFSTTNENWNVYSKLRSTSHVLAIISACLIVVTAILYFIASLHVVVSLLLINSIVLIITGNIIMHYKLLRRH